MNQKMLIGIITICMIIVISTTSATYLFMNDLKERELTEQKNLYEADINNLSDNITSLTIQVENLTEQIEEETDDYITLDDGTIVTGDFDKIEVIDYETYKTEQYVDDFEDDLYHVSGELKNIGNKILDEVVITIRYFDGMNSYIGSTQESTKYLAPDDEWYFWMTHLNYIPYYEAGQLTGWTNISHVSFDISVS